VAFVGKTGSGKTYAAKLLSAQLPRLVVFDPKGTLYDAGWNLEEWNDGTAKRLEKGKPVRIRIAAPLDNNWEPYFRDCYFAGNCTVYIDELYGVLERANAGDYLRALYTRGRELNIGVWASTQRPSWVPLFALSEADWIFLFRLQMETDRKRMSEIMGQSVRRQELKNHEVLVYHQTWENPKHYDRVNAKTKTGQVKELVT
jgi:DNA helicase HerA-like ATPase